MGLHSLICSMCFESNNTNLLLRLLIAVLGTSTLLQIPNIVKVCLTTWHRALENLVTSLHLIYRLSLYHRHSFYFRHHGP